MAGADTSQKNGTAGTPSSGTNTDAKKKTGKSHIGRNERQCSFAASLRDVGLAMVLKVAA
jgi:hypothetical protein